VPRAWSLFPFEKERTTKMTSAARNPVEPEVHATVDEGRQHHQDVADAGQVVVGDVEPVAAVLHRELRFGSPPAKWRFSGSGDDSPKRHCQLTV
jgi:hypothetical protein